MSRVTVQWHGDAWLARMHKAVDDGLYAAASVASQHAVTSMSKPGPSTPGDYPGTDTGIGRASIVAVHPREMGTPGRAAYGSNVRYMRKLEFGGRVEPRTKRYLTVPLTREAKLLRRRNVDLRTVPGLRLVHRKGFGGFPVLLLGKGRGKDFKAWFVLKPYIYIPARPWAMRSARESKRVMFDVFARTIRDAAGVVAKGGA